MMLCHFLDILTLGEDAIMLSWNERNWLPSDTVSYPRRMETSATLLHKPNKLQYKYGLKIEQTKFRIYFCFCWMATDIVIWIGSHNRTPFWCASVERKVMGQWVKKGVTRQICVCEWNIDRKDKGKVLTIETLLKTRWTNAGGH